MTPVASCPGMGATKVSAVVRDDGFIGLQPTVYGFPLGIGYPMFGAGIVATGTTSYNPNAGTTSIGLSDVLGTQHVAHTGVSPYTFELLGPDNVTPDGNAYNQSFGGKSAPQAWAEGAATPASSLTFYEMIRVDRGLAVLTNTQRGADYGTSSVTSFVSSGRYTQYLAWTLNVVFDSTCKRDLYLTRAGSANIDNVLPTNDTKGLGALLVDAGAAVAVHVIALGQAAAAKTILDATTCSNMNVGGCNALVTQLTALGAKVGTSPAPAAFAATQQGTNDWFVDAVGYDFKSSL
jgi:hypothetical protein